ncbi:hypothetical protein GGX14DRAFT_553435 [Mycena pura]|uniref:Uncharacterized protein n=1 Tax=Mycena pura TaxID=153505 RepID=A0AAD6YV60_9AGAR|nr:hypothetical protein GGX14DRAFT_553435 [Mycena pura]
MADPLAPFVDSLPDNIRDTIQVADDAAQAGLATNYPSATRQVNFLCEQARDIPDVAEFMNEAAKISVFCEHVSSFVNKCRQYAPMQSNVPEDIAKLYDFHENLQIARRRLAKPSPSTLTVPAANALAVVETTGRKSKKRKAVISPATVDSDADLSEVEVVVEQDVDMDAHIASSKKSSGAKSSKANLPTFNKSKAESSTRPETVCIPYVRNAQVDKLSPGYVKAMKILQKTNSAEADKVFAEYSRAPPRPRRYRARSRYRCEEAYSPLQTEPGVKRDEVDPDFVQAILDAGANIDIPDDALLRKEVSIRGKMVDFMHEMAYAHHMYTQVRAEHDKTVKMLATRKLKAPQILALSPPVPQLSVAVTSPSTMELFVDVLSLVAALIVLLVVVTLLVKLIIRLTTSMVHFFSWRL